MDFEIIDEIRVASAAETLLAVAKDLGVLDLVIIGDSALHQGACTIDRLVEIDWQRIGFTSPQLLYERRLDHRRPRSAARSQLGSEPIGPLACTAG